MNNLAVKKEPYTTSIYSIDMSTYNYKSQNYTHNNFSETTNHVIKKFCKQVYHKSKLKILYKKWMFVIGNPRRKTSVTILT